MKKNLDTEMNNYRTKEKTDNNKSRYYPSVWVKNTFSYYRDA